ncbi:MAG: outer membrane beta-barrel protein [Gammaproteobacteria bacterium]|jgi:hypothetical protein|nr:outer membrane beta-barrel protein [Gammaproteobacteria bacterium]
MKRIIFSILCLLVAGPLAAQDDASLFSKKSWYDGFYVGAGSGFLRVDTKLSSNGLAPTPTEPIESDDFRTTSIAGKGFVGYRIIRYAGIEIGYFKAFDVEESYCFTDTSGECTESRGGGVSVVSSSAWTVKLPTSGYTAAVTGFWPINDTFELMIKAGGIKSDITGDASELIVGGLVPPKPPPVPQFTTPVVNKEISSDWDAMGAFGINFNSESGISVRAEVEYFNIKAIDEPWLVSLNAIYNF